MRHIQELQMSKRRNEIHPYRLSESTLNILNTCERKFELNRLLISQSTLVDEAPNATLVRGNAFGAAVQDYMLTGDMDHACYVLWMNYDPEVYDEQKKIYLWRAINNLRCCKDALDKLRARYKVATFEGKPAAEMSFRLNIDDKWHYVGYIDLVLYDTVANIYVVMEIKTTAYKILDLTALYKNSGQALGYSIVIDRIVGEKQAKYGVLYFVCRDQQGTNFVPDVYTFPFTKTLLDRLRWFYTVGLDVQRLNTMLDNAMFPMRGGACIHFNRVCQHFGHCNLTSADISRKVPEDEIEYQFVYDIKDVIADHVARVKEDMQPVIREVSDVEVVE